MKGAAGGSNRGLQLDHYLAPKINLKQRLLTIPTCAFPPPNRCSRPRSPKPCARRPSTTAALVMSPPPSFAPFPPPPLLLLPRPPHKAAVGPKYPSWVKSSTTASPFTAIGDWRTARDEEKRRSPECGCGPATAKCPSTNWI